MIQKVFIIGFGLFVWLTTISALAQDKVSFFSPTALQKFAESRKDLHRGIQSLAMAPGKDTLDQVQSQLQTFQTLYASIPRQQVKAEDLYEAQFQLRFINVSLKNTLRRLFKSQKLTKLQKANLEYKAQIRQKGLNEFHQTPRREIPIEGVRASDWPLQRWEEDPDLYQYTFTSKGVLFRGIEFQSGDVLLNHPKGKPVGLFTAISENTSVFSHAALVVLLERPQGVLPVVIDIHERGVRAVPLYHYLSDKVISYAEVFRYPLMATQGGQNARRAISQAVDHLMGEEHPYDLSGSEDRKALNCAEMISFVLELLGDEKVSLKNRIHDRIYENILRFGNLSYQTMPMPNDIFMDERYQYVGYIDNVSTLEFQVANEVILEAFRSRMIHKVVDQGLNLSRFFGEVAIDQMRNKQSFLGGFLLGATGFSRENFPAGDRKLLTAVNAIDHTLLKVMNRCLSHRGILPSSPCYERFRLSAQVGPEAFGYSMVQWRNNFELVKAMEEELSNFDRLFEEH